MPINLFVSYSHEDRMLVGPIVALLRIQGVVFYDQDSIQPGKIWRDQLEKALSESHTIIVFWCFHASLSVEVKNEYTYALGKGKDILPVLIDDTPLPSSLAAYQWIDFRAIFDDRHNELPSSPQQQQQSIDGEYYADPRLMKMYRNAIKKRETNIAKVVDALKTEISRRYPTTE